MRALNRLLAGLFVGGIALMAVPEIASAAGPGTCGCNSGCHESPGMCLQKNFCSVGYVPSCGYRGTDDAGLPVCPKVGYISCNGVCTCVPIPGGCDVFPDADYCDSGPKDSGTDTPVDTFADVSDSTVPDTTTETSPPPDTTPPPDVPPDVPPDAPPPDVPPDVTPPPDTPDTCVPAECPPGTKAIAIPGECDPFCANPCGSIEFGCKGFIGTECKDGFCIPKCLITPCPACLKCSIGTGTCFDDGSCSDGGTDGGGDGGGDGSGGDGSGGDGSGDDTGGSGGDSSSGDAIADTDFLPPDPGTDLRQGDEGSCGCHVPGGVGELELGAIAGAAALALLVMRRRPRS